jgi:DNA-binding transcriptional LysR family regulator
VTQSAVSKRIAALEDELGFAVTEPDGRRVRLTPAGHQLLEQTRPLLAELRHALTSQQAGSAGLLSVGVSESLLASWAAPALAAARDRIDGLELAIGAHRSPVAIERVRAGEYVLALCAGVGDPGSDLSSMTVAEEEMVVVPSGLRRFQIGRARELPVLTIEPGSATWRSLRGPLAALRRERGLTIRVDRTVQSFSCVVQMARAGFGHGLAPRPLALAMGVPARQLIRLPAPGLARPISLIGRPRALARPVVAELARRLADAAR